MLTLYFAPFTCALAPHIALLDTGAAFHAERVDFKNAEQRSPAYLAINPKGRVPSLITDRGILTETPAILAFIAQSFPEAKLAPIDDPFAFAQAQAFNSYLASTVHVAHAHRLRGERWADDPAAIEAMRRKVPVTVAECMSMIEDNMLAGPWVMGADYTICDPYLFTICRWLEGDSVDINRFPKLAQHNRLMAERPSVKAALAAQA